MPASLVLHGAIFDDVLAHLRAAAPLEGVGLIAVAEGAQGAQGTQERTASDEYSVTSGSTGYSSCAPCAPCAPSAPCAPWVAVRFYPGTNGAASPTRYTMPPEEVLAAMQDMAANGWRLGAIAHSHPRGAATPSPTDLREAFYPEALMVIVSLAEPRAHARAWWVGAGDGRPREVPIVDPRDSDPLQPRQGSDG